MHPLNGWKHKILTLDNCQNIFLARHDIWVVHPCLKVSSGILSLEIQQFILKQHVYFVLLPNKLKYFFNMVKMNYKAILNPVGALSQISNLCPGPGGPHTHWDINYLRTLSFLDKKQQSSIVKNMFSYCKMDILIHRNKKMSLHVCQSVFVFKKNSAIHQAWIWLHIPRSRKSWAFKRISVKSHCCLMNTHG